MLYFHPVVACLVLCLFFPWAGIPLLVLMVIYYLLIVPIFGDKGDENKKNK
ncbi:hypothetical protein [Oleiphilus sp. HI0117]|uniref:hypothetical protein n=1 Tax=Oleiphilus sp. HI0117 TaxID=1822261 RepID=UPI000ADC1B83|nr:hypothetical protein [Oleiphilus sp. HI0117]